MNPTAIRTLSTADARRETVLQTAGAVFASRGFSGTPTTEIARAAGISHAYLFRLYPTKSDLAVAVAQRCHDRIHDAFAEAAAKARAAGQDPLRAMGHAYGELVQDRELVLLQLHSHAAAVDDAAMREASRAGFARLVALVERETGADPAAVGSFFASGMLINVMAALGATEVDEPWAQTLTTYCLGDDAA